MKSILFAPAISIIMAVAQSSPAQDNRGVTFNDLSIVLKSAPSKDEKKVIKLNSSNRSKNVREFISSHRNLIETAVTGVNVKAARHFSRSHKGDINPQWYKTNVGFVAVFNVNGKETRSVYKDGGSWFYDLHSYTEDKLELRIRDLVKRNFYDNSILIVYQYDFENKTVYVIRMSDTKSNIMTIKVCDGIIEDVSHPNAPM